jgi:hypothetical protein
MVYNPTTLEGQMTVGSVPGDTIRTLGRESQRTLDFLIRLVPWENKQTRRNTR